MWFATYPTQSAMRLRLIQTDTSSWVAWKAIDLEVVPVAEENTRTESHAVLRMYTAQSRDLKVGVMPGGLAACNHDASWAQLVKYPGALQRSLGDGHGA